MASLNIFYELSPEADRDLEDIFEYTESHFGLDQARGYVSAFEAVFQQLCRTPYLGKHRKEIRVGLRSLVKEQHVVFYRILADRIRIVRVLHGSRDVLQFTQWRP
ncbi:MAG: type II toxin-antitoxin system RelE/ParE family toxin [Nitrospirales bacterium]|nr:type II toxin-antitoxin system RelE/ParE family toxin [Nitrospirales bacterium]